MTTLPSTAERFAIVPLPDSGPAPDEAIVVGPMREVMEYIPQSTARNDAIEELEHARVTADEIARIQDRTRGVQVASFCDAVGHLSARLDALMQRRADAARARAKDDEEAEQQRIQAELDALPSPDDPDAYTPGSEMHPAKSAPSEDQAGDPSKGEMEMPETEPPESKGSVSL